MYLKNIIVFIFEQVKSGTIFDNFLIADDVKEAEEFGEETWGKTKVAQLDNTDAKWLLQMKLPHLICIRIQGCSKPLDHRAVRSPPSTQPISLETAQGPTNWPSKRVRVAFAMSVSRVSANRGHVTRCMECVFGP